MIIIFALSAIYLTISFFLLIGYVTDMRKEFDKELHFKLFVNAVISFILFIVCGILAVSST